MNIFKFNFSEFLKYLNQGLEPFDLIGIGSDTFFKNKITVLVRFWVFKNKNKGKGSK